MRGDENLRQIIWVITKMRGDRANVKYLSHFLISVDVHAGHAGKEIDLEYLCVHSCVHHFRGFVTCWCFQQLPGQKGEWTKKGSE